MLNRRGGIECDFTVTRLAEERFRIVTGTAFGQHDLAWIREHAPPGVAVDDVTSSYACLGLWGPKAREILQPLTTTPLDFGYMRARELAVGHVPCLALRVTYVGELGWELYCPTEFGLALWDAIWEAGREHGLVAGGYRAIDSLRLEKGYRVWGADITPDDTPYEAGLGFAVKLDKGDFIGREALLAGDASRNGASAASCSTTRAPSRSARSRCASTAPRRPRHERRLRLHGRALDRLRLPAGRARRRSAGRSRSRSSASGSPARSPPSRCSTRRATASARERGRACRPGLARRRRSDRAARRRDHEPQLQGARSPARPSCCGSAAATRRCSGSTARSSTTRRVAAAGARHRAGGGRLRRARGLPGHPVRRGRGRARSPRPRRRGCCAVLHTAAPIPGRFDPFRVVEAYAATARAAGVPLPARLRAGAGDRRPDRAPAAAGGACPLPQRPARRQLHPRRAAALDRRLGVRRHGRPGLRSRELRRQQRPRRGRRPRAARGLRRRRRAARTC